MFEKIIPWVSVSFVSPPPLHTELSVLQCCWLAESQWWWRETQGSRAEPVTLYTSQPHCTALVPLVWTVHNMVEDCKGGLTWFTDVCQLVNRLNPQIILSERFSHFWAMSVWVAAAVIWIWHVAPEIWLWGKSSYSANCSELCEASLAEFTFKQQTIVWLCLRIMEDMLRVLVVLLDNRQYYYLLLLSSVVCSEQAYLVFAR